MPPRATHTDSGQSSETPDVKTAETTDVTKAEGTAPTEVKADAKKPPTRAQLAKAKADQVKAEQDRLALESAPTYHVAYPTGISLYAPDETEVEVTMSGGRSEWVDVVNDHIHVPGDARIRPTTMAQATEFARLAGQGFLQQVPAS